MKASHPALPPRNSLPWALGAVGIWVAVALTGQSAPGTVADGPFHGEVTLTSDVTRSTYGSWALADLDGLPVLLDIEGMAGRGDRLIVSGVLMSSPGLAGGRSYVGVLSDVEIEDRRVSGFLPHRLARLIRARVDSTLEPWDDGRALLAGFLVGDTSRLDETDMDAMRKSGLAHFVAVSGSNVALFLGVLFVVAGPLASGPRRRAVLGLLALPVYAAVTRFEPSVMRATVMAGMALTGRLVGLVLEAWQLLSLAVAVLVVTDPGLTGNLGFQLSVVATAGVLVGARWPVRGAVGRAIAVTGGAQVAVAPLLLISFGSVPLLSPLLNLVSAPLVALATGLGMAGVMGVPAAIPMADWVASIVLLLARSSAHLPQLGPAEVVGVACLVALWVAVPGVRSGVTIVVAMSVVLALVGPGRHLAPGTVVVLDVGQGDAILLDGGDGHFALVDGGPDPVRALDALRRYSVRSLDLVVLTHVHADHAAGLVGVVSSLPVGMLWIDPGPHDTESFEELMAEVESRGLPVQAPRIGEVYRLGVLTLEVIGPLRRYAGPNDQSIVVMCRGPGRDMLLAGDVESVAQHDLGELHADVLKVPHHGSDTPDPAWLTAVGADVAVIPVGENDFGHPSASVVSDLEASGAIVRRTDRDGDVIVSLGPGDMLPYDAAGRTLEPSSTVGGLP